MGKVNGIRSDDIEMMIASRNTLSKRAKIHY